MAGMTVPNIIITPRKNSTVTGFCAAHLAKSGKTSDDRFVLGSARGLQDVRDPQTEVCSPRNLYRVQVPCSCANG